MFLWPSTTPGRVSTSTSCSASRWTCAKFRICSWAKRMSSRSCPVSRARQASISPALSRKSSRSQLSNLIDMSRTAASPRRAMSFNASSTTRRTFSSAARRLGIADAGLQVSRHRDFRSLLRSLSGQTGATLIFRSSTLLNGSPLSRAASEKASCAGIVVC